MTERERYLYFSTLEFIRKELGESLNFSDKNQKEIDDYIFSNLDYTISDLDAIYAGRNVTVNAGCAIEGFAPRSPIYAELMPFHWLNSKFRFGKISSGDIGVVVSTDAGKPVVLTSADAPALSDLNYDYRISLEHSGQYNKGFKLKDILAFFATNKVTGQRIELYSVESKEKLGRQSSSSAPER